MKAEELVTKISNLKEQLTHLSPVDAQRFDNAYILAIDTILIDDDVPTTLIAEYEYFRDLALHQHDRPIIVNDCQTMG